MNKKSYKEKYQRMELKNGYDLPEGQEPPLTGRKQEMRRAYELLILKDESANEMVQKSGKMEIDDSHTIESSKKTSRKTSKNASRKTSKNASKNASKDASKEETSVTEVLQVISREELKARKKKKLLVAAGLLLAMAVVIAGRLLLGPAILTADIGSYKDVKIEVAGIEKKPVYITAGQLADMKKKSIKVDVHQGEVPEGETAEQGEAIGPTLETFLAHYDKKPEDYRAMRVYQENGNSKAYVRTMKEKEIILSVANGGDPLGEKQAPLRIATEDENAEEWFGWVRKVEFK